MCVGRHRTSYIIAHSAQRCQCLRRETSGALPHDLRRRSVGQAINVEVAVHGEDAGERLALRAVTTSDASAMSIGVSLYLSINACIRSISGGVRSCNSRSPEERKAHSLGLIAMPADFGEQVHRLREAGPGCQHRLHRQALGGRHTGRVQIIIFVQQSDERASVSVSVTACPRAFSAPCPRQTSCRYR